MLRVVIIGDVDSEPGCWAIGCCVCSPERVATRRRRSCSPVGLVTRTSPSTTTPQPGMAELSEYELQRLAQIKRNHEQLESLGLLGGGLRASMRSTAPPAASSAAPPPAPRIRKPQSTVATRWSSRPARPSVKFEPSEPAANRTVKAHMHAAWKVVRDVKEPDTGRELAFLFKALPSKALYPDYYEHPEISQPVRALGPGGAPNSHSNSSMRLTNLPGACRSR